MTLTIELTPEETRRVEAARRRGVDVDAMVRQMIAQMPDTETPTIVQEILAAWQEAGVIGSRSDIKDSQTIVYATEADQERALNDYKALHLSQNLGLIDALIAATASGLGME